jgi:uncharacterized protein (TIGR02001 family)
MKARNLLISAALAAAVTTPAAAAEVAGGDLSANVGVVTNYLFRGVTQTDDKPAVQGGIDWAHSSGFYVGTWLSNVDFEGDFTDEQGRTGTFDANYELDLYAGYDFDLGDDWSLGLNGIYYAYPDSEIAGDVTSDDDEDIDYAEVGVSGGWRFLSAAVQYTVWGDVDDGAFTDGDLHYSGGAEFDIGNGFSLAANIGYYDFDAADEYTHWHIGVSKDAGDFGSFSFNYEQTDGDEDDDVATDDDPNLWIGWSITFE